MENNIPVDIQFLIQYLSRKKDSIRFDSPIRSINLIWRKRWSKIQKDSRRCYGAESNLDFCIIHRVERVPFVRLKSPHFSSSSKVERKNVKLGQ